MTVPAPRLRSPRQWALAAGQTAVCMALGLLLILISFGMELEAYAEDPPPALATLYALDALIGITASIAVGPLRFVRPGRAHSATHLLLAMLAGCSVWAMPASAIALYRLGLRRRLVLDAGALLLVGGMSMTVLTIDAHIRGEGPRALVMTTVGVMLMVSAVPLLIGHVIGTRHELLMSLRARATSADREREAADRERLAAELARAAAEREAEALMREHDADAARVRAEERTALARDMHDSISHHLAAIAMHAGAMSYRDDLPPEEMRRAALTVRDAAHQANQELRTVLMTLRAEGGDAPLPTAPTLLAIVERCRGEGQDVELSWSGVSPEELSGRERSTVVALARVLTEATTNAAKHAPGQPLRVRISRVGSRVVLTARNPLSDADRAGDDAEARASDQAASAPSTGHGLLGVQERARLLGGDASHGARDGSFEVEAWVPW